MAKNGTSYTFIIYLVIQLIYILAVSQETTFPTAFRISRNNHIMSYEKIASVKLCLVIIVYLGTYYKLLWYLAIVKIKWEDSEQSSNLRQARVDPEGEWGTTSPTKPTVGISTTK